MFDIRKSQLEAEQAALFSRENQRVEPGNGIFWRYRDPVVTSAHAPLFWRYDYDRAQNPFFMERLGINAVFNAGAILHEGRYLVMCRVEGWDRKSFFAVAESPNGVDRFRFWDAPVELEEVGLPTTNVYDMRLTAHEDGCIYGIFCAERRDPTASPTDTSSAVAAAGIARTRDLKRWQRLPDLVTPSPQQRNVVLHPRFVGGKYLLYTRPQDGFIDAGSGGGLAYGLSDSMEGARIEKEIIVDAREYHTIKEAKNGAGAPPIETPAGYLHVAHGVRNTAAGLRYVLYAVLTAREEPWRVTAAPGGYLMAPEGDERVGDVSNVVFSNGAIVDPSGAEGGRVLVYYGSSDTRLHVAESSVDRLVDYVTKTPPDGRTSAASVAQRMHLIKNNLARL